MMKMLIMIQEKVRVKRALPFCLLTLLLFLFSGCTAEDSLTAEGRGEVGDDIVGQPVLFTVGNVGQDMTRAGIPYMAKGGCFVCTMYYHATAGDDGTGDFDIIAKGSGGTGGTATTSWLKVDNNVGNSVYRLSTLVDPTSGLDKLGFDKTATIFFWQNRLPHAFLALADYNKLTNNNGSETTGTLKLHPVSNFEIDFNEPAEDEEDPDPTGVADNRYANVYDLRRGNYTLDDDNKEVISDTKSSITQQPDPILALTVMKPAGATQEANRVELYFKHQFSQIQVNLKGAADESAEIEASQILSVELLGVSETGYVYNRLNANGTIGEATGSGIALTGGAALGKEVRLDAYTDDELKENKWGTSFSMFDMGADNYAIGFLKSYNAIAFGQLSAIRIKWQEKVGESNPQITHVSTFEVPATNEEGVDLHQLASGKRYVYDLELRRGTLAIIRTQIMDWMQKSELVWDDKGTITD